jgi:hypothetical protein
MGGIDVRLRQPYRVSRLGAPDPSTLGVTQSCSYAEQGGYSRSVREPFSAAEETRDTSKVLQIAK